MTARLLDGRAVAREIADDVRREVELLARSGRPAPTIAVVRVAEDAASVRYANQIQRGFAAAGLGFRLRALPATIDDAGLIACLKDLGADRGVTAILLQFPLPVHLTYERIVESVDPLKDVDGVNPINAGRLFVGRGRYFAPATALGGVELLRRSGVALAGKRAVVVGRSEIVGRPLAMLLLRRHATVTIAHSRTADLAALTREADILAVAAGRPGLITGDMVSPGAVVLDFGVNVVDGKLVGDVDYASVAPLAAAITPVPGGTGPMTNAMLLTNAIEAAKWQAS